MVKFLADKKKEIERLADEEKQKARRIDAYLNNIKLERKMESNVILKELPEVIVASMREVIPNYEEFNNFYPKMGKLMAKHGARCAVPEYCFTIYHDGEYREKDIDVEICQAVEERLPSADGVSYKLIKAFPTAACILHKGPYSTIGKSYEAVFSWIEGNGYRIVDNPRESYIDGIWNKEDPADWLTEIQVPIAKK
ncbi:MAG: Bacterial transcription activator, effector binding domain [bacterium ADurb.Bin400]|nr:MAG: Bacterial transcription activator, effector binding domain [bacterium ADurb.Bin400]